MTTGKKIAQARKEMGRDWTQNRLAEALQKEGLTHTRAWVAGAETDRIPPHADDIKIIAKVLKKPVEFFRADSSVGFGHAARHGGDSFVRDSPLGVDMESFASVSAFVPVLGTVTADRFAFSLDAIPEEQIPNPYAGKKVFALQVRGDCMEPTFRNGEYIYFSLTQPVADGKVVLARLDTEHTLKRYFKRTNGIELKPDNPKYQSKTYATNKLEIVAVAVGRYGKL